MARGSNLSSRALAWWRKRQKEKKRLALLALVRKVREEQGDYDRDAVLRVHKPKTTSKKVDAYRRLSRSRKR